MNRRRLAAITVAAAVYPFSGRTQDLSEYQPVNDPDVIWNDQIRFVDEKVALLGTLISEVEIPKSEGVLFSRHVVIELHGGAETRWGALGMPSQLSGYQPGDVVHVYCRLKPLKLELRLDGTAVSGLYFSADYMQYADPDLLTAQDHTVSTNISDSPTAQGETLAFDDWEVEVTDAYVLPDAIGTNRLYFLVVDLLVRNLNDQPRVFDGPDTDFRIRSAEGWVGNFDIFGTSQIRVSEDQWTSAFTKGFDYPLTLVFSVTKHDPNLFADGLHGWILTIEMGSNEYQVVVGDPRDPGGILP